MSAELISILVLAVIIVIATTRSINMGALAFTAAFAVGTLAAGMDADAIFSGFPGDLFVILVGITYLFAIAKANGTTDWMVHSAIRLVRGRVFLIPWVLFVITGVLTAIGAASPAAVAITAPIGLSLAARYNISPLLMGALIVHGAQGGGFSPISIFGGIVNGIVSSEGLPGSPMVLFLGSLVVNLIIAAIVFVVCGGLKLPRHAQVPATVGGGGSGDADSLDTEPSNATLNAPRIATLVALGVLVVAVLVFELDAGLSAITLAVILSLIWPNVSKSAVNGITWPTVLLICGVLTYVGVMETIGTINYAGNSVTAIGIPMLSALLICYIGAIVSAFASSTGIMGALIPLAVPFLEQGEVGAIGLITAFALSSTVVDVSPFSTNGALVLASAEGVDRDRFFKQLMVYGAIIVVVAPVVLWLAMVVPNLG